MTTNQKNDILNHLHRLEEMTESKFAEMNPSRFSRDFFVSNAGHIATEIACLQEQQKETRFILQLLGYYVVYENNHATEIVADE